MNEASPENYPLASLILAMIRWGTGQPRINGWVTCESGDGKPAVLHVGDWHWHHKYEL